MPHDIELERALWRQAGETIEEEFVKIAKDVGVDVRVILVKESKHKHVGWAVCAKAEELEVSDLVRVRRALCFSSPFFVCFPYSPIIVPNFMTIM